jgi:putative FmdB family regulatory protein
MPFYEYECSNCGHQLEELQSMNEKPLLKCPACGKNTLKRLIGTGAGLIFKGSGFYLTDYKNKGASPQNKDAKEKTEKHKGKDSKDSKHHEAKHSESTKTASKKKESK